MKKNNRVLRIGLLALVLTLVTASLVSGTFAKYVTAVNGTGTVKVANWKADLKKGTDALTTQFDLFDTINGSGDVDQDGQKRVAPGTSGSFILSYDTATTEVDHTVTLTITKASGTIPTNMNFTITPTADFGTTAQTDVQFGAPVLFKKDYTAASNGGTGTVNVNWVWAFESGSDSTDTSEGETFSAADLKFDAVFTAVQTNGFGS